MNKNKTIILAELKTSENIFFLNNNQISAAFGLNSLNYIIAIGVKLEFYQREKNFWDELKAFIDKYNRDYIFGYFSYDIKNKIENLTSNNADNIGMPECYFFVPEHLGIFKENKLEILSGNKNKIENFLFNLNHRQHSKSKNLFKSKVNKNTYIKNVEKIKQHIIAGDVYELNYCIEFFKENIQIDPIQVYAKLNQLSPTPFSAYIQINQHHLMCASPERFLKKVGNKIYSQPIKGTIKRGSTSEEDEILKNQLFNSEKERAENLMIVDLVRNDLAKSCKTGSIKVEELFGIYTFKQVHQMISTVSGTVKNELHNLDIIKNAFPMGSMTGAPKVMAMQLIEKYETTKRGLYSGAVGYFAPNGDFDFNVVIRSLQYNAEKKYLNAMVGSAITFDSIAEEEYNECLLKAEVLMQALKP